MNVLRKRGIGQIIHGESLGRFKIVISRSHGTPGPSPQHDGIILRRRGWILNSLAGQPCIGQSDLGRSALDAVELMNVGVNYMREHMSDQARIHYAYIDALDFPQRGSGYKCTLCGA